VETATKTRDNVTLKVCTAIQFKVEEDKVSEFRFRLKNPNRQLESYVHDAYAALPLPIPADFYHLPEATLSLNLLHSTLTSSPRRQLFP